MRKNDLIDFEWQEDEERARLFDPDDPVLHEPRAFWDYLSIRLGVSGTPDRDSNRFQLDPRRFTNKSKYQVVLTHINFAPLGYMLSRQVGVTPTVNSATFWNSEAILGLMKFRLAGVGRQQFSPTFIPVSSYLGQPSGLKTFPAGYSVGGLNLDHASPLDNVLLWDFEKPYWIPPTGGIEMAVTPYRALDSFEEDGVVDPGNVTLGFTEQWTAGNRFSGHAKFINQQAGQAQNGLQQPFPVGIVATPGDTFAVTEIPSTPVGATRADFNLLSTKRQKEQRDNAGGASRNWVTGLRIAIDQVLHDEGALARATATSPPGYDPSCRFASLAGRFGMRAKSFAGGTYRSWWRDYIPLPLITQTRSSAHVHRLSEPVVLAPNDGISVELELPERPAAYQDDLFPFFNIGVSLTGFAKVIS